MTKNQIKFLNEKQVSGMISKSVAWLQRKRWEGGAIPFHKIGRSVRYSETDVISWLAENAHRCTSTSEYVKSEKDGCKNE